MVLLCLHIYLSFFNFRYKPLQVMCECSRGVRESINQSIYPSVYLSIFLVLFGPLPTYFLSRHAALWTDQIKTYKVLPSASQPVVVGSSQLASRPGLSVACLWASLLKSMAVQSPMRHRSQRSTFGLHVNMDVVLLCWTFASCQISWCKKKKKHP